MAIELQTGGVSAAALQSMDLEAAIMAVQSDRANNLEVQLKNQLADVAKRNETIASLNKLLTDIRAQRPAGKTDDKATLDAALSKRMAEAGLTLTGTGIATNAASGGSADPTYTMTQAKFDTIAEEIKSKIDSASNSQQMDMLRLQSLSNKRNEAFEIMTNFVKKMSDNRSSIVGNLR